MATYLSELIRRSLRRLPQLLPSSCALCQQSGPDALCQHCRQRYFQRQPQRCLQCAIPTTIPTARCGNCIKHKPAFDATIVVTDYVAPADQLVLSLKFNAMLTLAPLMAQLLHERVERMTRSGKPGAKFQPTLLTAVPLGPHRLQERGFNQALEIAKPLSALLGIQLNARLLVRVSETQAQTMLPLAQRRQNMRRAFVVPHDALLKVRGQHIGVVDDVMTTGATLDELATTLKRFGARSVTNLVFARTLAH